MKISFFHLLKFSNWLLYFIIFSSIFNFFLKFKGWIIFLIHSISLFYKNFLNFLPLSSLKKLLNMFQRRLLLLCWSVCASVSGNGLSVCLSVYQSVCLGLFINLSVHLSVYLSVCLYQSVCLYVGPSVCLSVCQSDGLSVC